MAQSELEKLQRRYEEKPSQWFAALAEEYRRDGDIDLALEIVREGLEERSGYVSGHIVLARCLLDKGDDIQAEQSLKQVLGLDSENIIALKILAEISERAGNSSGAEEWVQKLLEVDPMNEDAQEMLVRLGESSEAASDAGPVADDPAVNLGAAHIEVDSAVNAPAPAPVPEAPDFEDPSSIGEIELSSTGDVPDPGVGQPVDIEPKPALEIETGQPDPSAVFGEDLERAEAELPLLEMAAIDDDPGGIQEVSLDEAPAQPSSLDDVQPPVEIDSLAVDSADDGLDQAGEAVGEVEDLGDTTEDEIPTVPDIALLAADADGESADQVEDADIGAGGGGGLDGLPMIDGLTDAPPAMAEPEPVVTETMAEVYIKQGLLHEARDVYRQLVAQQPDNPRFQARLTELDCELHAVPASEPDSPAYGAADGGGLSTRSFLNRVLNGGETAGFEAEAASDVSTPPSSIPTLDGPPSPEPPPLPEPLVDAAAPGVVPPEEAPAPIEPIAEVPATPDRATRPAEDDVSLTAVFGEDSPPLPTVPTSSVPSESDATPAGDASGKGMSFDQFFSGGDDSPEGSVLDALESDAEPAEDPEFKDWLRRLQS